MWAKVDARHRSVGSNVPQLHVAVGIAGGHSVSLERGKERQRYLVRHNNVILKFYMDLIILTPLLSLSPSLCYLSLPLSFSPLTHSPPLSPSPSLSIYLSLPTPSPSLLSLSLPPLTHSLPISLSVYLSLFPSLFTHSLSLSLPPPLLSLSFPPHLCLSISLSLSPHSLTHSPSLSSHSHSLSLFLSPSHTHTQAHHTKLSPSE